MLKANLKNIITLATLSPLALALTVHFNDIATFICVTFRL